MTGVKPSAMEMSRTQLSVSPECGLIIFGVTITTSLTHPSSAVISSSLTSSNSGNSTYVQQSDAPCKYSLCKMLETARSDSEEGGVEGLRGEAGEEVGCEEGRAVVIGGDVGEADTAKAGPPPATGVVFMGASLAGQPPGPGLTLTR
jgi:hypothetical protein